jgi:hypothetical protein
MHQGSLRDLAGCLHTAAIPADGNHLLAFGNELLWLKLQDFFVRTEPLEERLDLALRAHSVAIGSAVVRLWSIRN